MAAFGSIRSCGPDQAHRGDLLQDAFAEATARLASYAEKSDLPLFLWLRWLTGMRLKRIHREHLDVKGRDARREVSLHSEGMPGASSAALAEQLLCGDTRPSEAAARAERKRRVEVALEAIDPTDREVLVLRHFEELSSIETARVLGITPAAASKRYVRALVELKRVLGPMLGESWGTDDESLRDVVNRGSGRETFSA